MTIFTLEEKKGCLLIRQPFFYKTIYYLSILYVNFVAVNFTAVFCCGAEASPSDDVAAESEVVKKMAASANTKVFNVCYT